MTDMIDRQAAIDAVHKCTDYYIGNLPTMIDKEDAYKALSALPSAQPERKEGQWIQYDNGTYYCSLCHSWIPEEQYHYARFCLYCGAEME